MYKLTKKRKRSKRMDMYKVVEVTNKRQLKQFVRFQRKLYKFSKFYVPGIEEEELEVLSGNTPMTDGCEFKMWIVLENQKIVGRISGIINFTYNQENNVKQARFSNFDFINETEVARVLINQVETWARNCGMTELVGPFGFSNLDKHGMLVHGYDKLSTTASNYNFLYYRTLIESYGYSKKIDWVERRIKVPKAKPEKMLNLSGLIAKRYGLQVLSVSISLLMENYFDSLLDLYNNSYSDLYGTNRLTKEQAKYLMLKYKHVLKPEFICIVVDNSDSIIAFGLTQTSMSRLFRFSNGNTNLLKVGYFCQKLLRQNVLDLLLIGVHPDYKGKGVTSLIFNHISQGIYKNGISYLETNQNLETNLEIQNLWKNYSSEIHKRSRLYQKNLQN